MRDGARLVLVGLLLGALATGWAMEARVRIAREQLYERAIAGMLADQVVLAEALRLGVPDPLTRALMGANAIRIVREREQARTK